MSRIDSFTGPHRWLSNFYPAVVWLDETCYPTVEHAYQAAKTVNAEEREVIRTSSSPAIAKKLGRYLTVRPDWEDIKLEIMADLIWQKFSNNPDLGNRLMTTGKIELVEGNWWGDTYWGVCKGVGNNHLGKLLMAVRDQLSGMEIS